MKKLVSILLTLAVAVSLCLVAVTPVAAGTITVGPGGSPAYDYATIQAAIDAASSGDTIIVASGTYEEEVKIMDKSLTLLGAQADVPIVNGEREGEESVIRGKGTGPRYPYSWCVVRIQNSNVVVNGFTIENGQRAIAIQGSSIRREGISDILISYNYIEESGKDGIFRDNAAANVIIDHNYIASNSRGIATNGGSTTITDNTFYDNGQGITFNGGDPYSVYFPDYDEPNYPTVISGNSFTNDSTSIYLRLDKCHQSITIMGNDITEAHNDAIRTWNVYDTDIVNPAIHYNNIVGSNNFGVNNLVGDVNLDATNNWWGHASGPSGDHGRVNKHGKVIGKGDAVSDNVQWNPWLPQPINLTPHAPVPPGLLHTK